MARTCSFNIRGIAAEANVSTATVSRVVNNHPGVDEAVRKRVLSILRRNEGEMARRGSRQVCILALVEVGSPVVEGFLSGVLSGMARYMTEHPVGIELCFIPPGFSGTSLLKMVREKRSDAVAGIFLGASVIRQVYGLPGHDIPAMLIGEKSDSPEVGHITVNSFRGAEAVVGCLASLGHRKIGYLSNNIEKSASLRERQEGFISGLEKNGLDPGECPVSAHSPTGNTYEAGYVQTAKLLSSGADVSAIFASTDEMAYGAMRACADAGRRVPLDISVAGFDDYPGSAYCTPSLTTVASDPAGMGFEAAKYLDMFVNGLCSAVPKLERDGVLVKRESCAPAADSVAAAGNR